MREGGRGEGGREREKVERGRREGKTQSERGGRGRKSGAEGERIRGRGIIRRRIWEAWRRNGEEREKEIDLKGRATNII